MIKFYPQKIFMRAKEGDDMSQALITLKKYPTFFEHFDRGNGMGENKVTQWKNGLYINFWFFHVGITYHTHDPEYTGRTDKDLCHCHGGWEKQFNVVHRYDCYLYKK